MRKGDSHAQRLGCVESSVTNERGLHAKRVRARGESHLLWKSEVEKERKDTGRLGQKTRQRTMLQTTKSMGADALADRKDGGSVATWKLS
jgi:hypothetical protein